MKLILSLTGFYILLMSGVFCQYRTKNVSIFFQIFIIDLDYFWLLSTRHYVINLIIDNVFKFMNKITSFSNENTKIVFVFLIVNCKIFFYNLKIM